MGAFGTPGSQRRRALSPELLWQGERRAEQGTGHGGASRPGTAKEREQ